MADHQGQGPVSVVSGAIHGDSILIGINGELRVSNSMDFLVSLTVDSKRAPASSS